MVDEKSELFMFVEKFRTSFDEALAPGGKGNWTHDGPQVLALARAIGAVAQYYIVKNGDALAALDAMGSAYQRLKPDCGLPRHPSGQYCSGVR